MDIPIGPYAIGCLIGAPAKRFGSRMDASLSKFMRHCSRTPPLICHSLTLCGQLDGTRAQRDVTNPPAQTEPKLVSHPPTADIIEASHQK